MAAIITSTSTQFTLEHQNRWPTEHHPEDPHGHHHHLGEDHPDSRRSHHSDIGRDFHGHHHRGSHGDYSELSGPHPHRGSHSDHDLHYSVRSHGSHSDQGERGEGHHYSDKRHAGHSHDYQYYSSQGRRRHGSHSEYEGHHHRNYHEDHHLDKVWHLTCCFMNIHSNLYPTAALRKRSHRWLLFGGGLIYKISSVVVCMANVLKFRTLLPILFLPYRYIYYMGLYCLHIPCCQKSWYS